MHEAYRKTLRVQGGYSSGDGHREWILEIRNILYSDKFCEPRDVSL